MLTYPAKQRYNYQMLSVQTGYVMLQRMQFNRNL